MIVRRIVAWITVAAGLVAPLMLRIALALPFFRSGLTKWDSPGVLSQSAAYLFSDEFRLHLFGNALAFPHPLLFAYIDGVAEIVLPVLLVFGLGTRISALALLFMTALIQLVVPNGWEAYHLPWATMALALAALGPGPISIDCLLSRSFQRKGSAGSE